MKKSRRLTLFRDKCAHLIKPALAFLATLDVKSQQLSGIMLDMPHLDRLRRSDDQRPTLALVLPNVLTLLVVAFVAVLKRLKKIWVGSIAGMSRRKELVRALFIGSVLGEDNNRPIETRVFERMLDGNGIRDAAV